MNSRHSSESTGWVALRRDPPSFFICMIYVIPGLGDKKYNFPKNIKYPQFFLFCGLVFLRDNFG